MSLIQSQILDPYSCSYLHWLPSTLLWLLQIPVTKNSTKTKDKSMSAESSRASTSSADREKAVIPYIELNVTEEERLKLDELLKNTSMPTLEQVWFD